MVVPGWRSRASSSADDSALERVERGERFFRLHALDVVAVHGNEADDPLAVDHEHGRSRQDPAALAVEPGHVAAHSLVQLARMPVDVVLEATGFDHLAALVGQDGELAILATRDPAHALVIAGGLSI